MSDMLTNSPFKKEGSYDEEEKSPSYDVVDVLISPTRNGRCVVHGTLLRLDEDSTENFVCFSYMTFPKEIFSLTKFIMSGRYKAFVVRNHRHEV